MTDDDEARQTILQRVAAIRLKGYTDEQWLSNGWPPWPMVMGRR